MSPTKVASVKEVVLKSARDKRGFSDMRCSGSAVRLIAINVFELRDPSEMIKGVEMAITEPTNSVPEEDLFTFEITDELRALAAGYESIGDRIRENGAPSELVADLFFNESDDS